MTVQGAPSRLPVLKGLAPLHLYGNTRLEDLQNSGNAVGVDHSEGLINIAFRTGNNAALIERFEPSTGRTCGVRCENKPFFLTIIALISGYTLHSLDQFS
jgi:hypothetical protein